MKLKHLPLYKIDIKDNIRSDPDHEIGELMQSIEEHDIIQPITVVPRGDRYELITGHRRYAAMKARHEPTIPAYIRDDLSESQIPLVKLAENIQRKQMSPREIVQVLNKMRLADPRLKTHAKLAKAIGKSPAWVSYKYRADQEYQKLMDSGVEDEVIDAMTERDLMEIGRVKKPKEKAAAARAKVKEKKKISDAKSYEISRRETYQFKVIARRKVEVMCGTDAALGQLLDYLGKQ